MIPLRDVIPTRTPPLVTIALILGQPVAAGGLALDRDLVYVAANALCLWLFGQTVEDRMGHGRFLAFYALCAAAAALTRSVAAAAPPSPLVAASGGVAGAMAAYLVLYPESRVVTLVPLPFFIRAVEVPAIFFACAWLLVQFAAASGIPALAGLAAGAAAVRLFRRRERMRVEWWNDL